MGGIFVVVHAAFRKNVRDLLPDAALAGPDGTDTFQQFPEIVLAEGRLSLLEPVVVQNEALEHELLQHAGRPDPKLRGTPGIDPVANGNDGVQIVELCQVDFSIRGSCRDFFGNCLLGQFTGGKDVFEVNRNIIRATAEQLAHGFLCEPNRFIFD